MKAIIEMPLGSVAKLEVSKDTGRLKLDRVIDIPVPLNYGFLENTLAGDGDPLDVFILTAAGSLPPLTEVEVEPFGVWVCLDNGSEDEKVLAVPVGEQMDSDYKMVAMREVSAYLKRYKPGFEVLRFEGTQEAKDLYEKCKRANLKLIVG